MFETNKATLRRHFDEVLNQGHLDVIDEIYGDSYILDAPVQTDGSVQAHGETIGRSGLKRRVTLFRSAFPDIHFSVDTMIAEGDQVLAQYTFKGTHTGQFGELPPSGRKISVMGMLIAVVQDGKIQSAVSVFDSGDMMHQLETDHKSNVHRFIDYLTGRRLHLITQN